MSGELVPIELPRKRGESKASPVVLTPQMHALAEYLRYTGMKNRDIADSLCVPARTLEYWIDAGQVEADRLEEEGPNQQAIEWFYEKHGVDGDALRSELVKLIEALIQTYGDETDVYMTMELYRRHTLRQLNAYREIPASTQYLLDVLTVLQWSANQYQFRINGIQQTNRTAEGKAQFSLICACIQNDLLWEQLRVESSASRYYYFYLAMRKARADRIQANLESIGAAAMTDATMAWRSLTVLEPEYAPRSVHEIQANIKREMEAKLTVQHKKAEEAAPLSAADRVLQIVQILNEARGQKVELIDVIAEGVEEQD